MPPPTTQPPEAPQWLRRRKIGSRARGAEVVRRIWARVQPVRAPTLPKVV